MRFNTLFTLVFTLISLSTTSANLDTCVVSQDANGCVSFTVGQGTGCAWMCEYCASQLGTSNYYFTDGICSYQAGGCVGSPVAGKTYTCCSQTLGQVE